MPSILFHRIANLALEGFVLFDGAGMGNDGSAKGKVVAHPVKVMHGTTCALAGVFQCLWVNTNQHS